MAFLSRLPEPSKWWKVLTIVLGLALILVFAGSVRPSFDWLPGIPTEAGASRDSFEEAFWPALYSGILAGVVTGIVVGFIVGAFLLVAERQLESRHRLRETRDAYNLFRNQVRRLTVLSDPPFRVPVSAESMTPLAARAAQKYAADKPHWEWQELFGSEDAFYAAFRRFNAEAAVFSQRASELDEILGLKVRLRDFSSVWPVYGHFAREMASYYVAKLLGLDQNRFILLSQPFEVHIGSLELTYVKLSEDQVVQDASAAYLVARGRLERRA